jgi:Polyketide cyclase / dehydrase and lipid transport
MPKVELQKTFNVPLDKVLEYFGDHDRYNKQHARDNMTCTVISRKDNEVLTEVKQEISGQAVKFANKTVYRLPKSIETETLSGIAQGSRQKVTFESVPEGTRVTYSTDFKMHIAGVAGKALGLVSGKMIKKMTRETMEESAEVDRKYLEGGQPQPPAPQ